MSSKLVLAVVFSAVLALAQDSNRKLVPNSSPEVAPENSITIPAGTKIPLVLKQTIWTKNAKENDSVYAATNFPVVIDGQTVVPPGTYVQGVITRVQRPGKIKGKAEVVVNFTSLIFPSGYTVLLPGAVENSPDTGNNVKDKEGTIQGDSTKGKDAATVAKVGAAGAGLGGLAEGGGKGVAIGGAAGAAVGLASVLFTRGPDLKIEAGSGLEMVVERPVVLDRSRIYSRN